ncbi:TetR/AcrR family transcriptional regulator [Ruegeria atlantica]|uniref:HTH-type transcriptional regulator EthR n=1 Tax=Ruegeria atlantica TaxID=81569 RepID=A0A0P1EZ61_9RHOB|nr:TetR/AcrR family transcriptional regulator [Ruegeria atlantica]CUH48770.1 HTH-type transcriptional regulator EthR [Ruegeria atlantica]
MSEKSEADANSKRVVRQLPPSKAALTRSAILDTGNRFLETRPFRELTVANLMAETEHSRSTFYLYFNDLHGLMETLLNEVKGGIVEGARAWLLNEADAVSGLHESLRALVDVGYQHGSILKAVADAAPSDERLEHVWETFLGSFDQVVSARIAQDQAKGITPEFDPLPVARALNRMDAGVLINAFGSVQKANKEEVLSAIMRIWISTLYPFDAAGSIGHRFK